MSRLKYLIHIRHCCSFQNLFKKAKTERNLQSCGIVLAIKVKTDDTNPHRTTDKSCTVPLNILLYLTISITHYVIIYVFLFYRRQSRGKLHPSSRKSPAKDTCYVGGIRDMRYFSVIISSFQCWAYAVQKGKITLFSNDTQVCK